MPRVPRQRQWTEGVCYHVLNRGHNRDTVFRADDDRRCFLDLLRRYRERFDARLYHYCLMTNHFHLLLQFPDPRALSPFVAGLLRAYVHYAHRRYGFVGHLWQGRFKSPAVDCDTYLLSCGRYIERNPVEAGLVEAPWDYRWSSAAAYASGQADGLLAANPWYEALAASAAVRQQRWREFLAGADPREDAIRCAEGAVGPEGFNGRLKDRRGRRVSRRRGRPATEFRPNSLAEND